MAQPDDERYWILDLADANVDDLQSEVDALRERRGRLVGIVDETAGGIIAYVITPGKGPSDGQAREIVDTLNAAEEP